MIEEDPQNSPRSKVPYVPKNIANMKSCQVESDDIFDFTISLWMMEKVSIEVYGE